MDNCGGRFPGLLDAPVSADATPALKAAETTSRLAGPPRSGRRRDRPRSQPQAPRTRAEGRRLWGLSKVSPELPGTPGTPATGTPATTALAYSLSRPICTLSGFSASDGVNGVPTVLT